MKLTIGEKIALLRKQKNITQTELAEYLFLAPQTVSRWEVGSGAPDITLLPRIAAFFGVSLDELFGVTSLERAEDLVCKYSVLRDDSSLREAMEHIDSQLQTVEACMKNAGADMPELERERDKLEAEKLHMRLQQGREAFQRAFEIADRFVQKTEGDPEHPWYLPMRLQRDQLCCSNGKGREARAERRRDFAEHPGEVTMLRYLSILNTLQDHEAVLAVFDADGPAQEIMLPPSEKNLPIWRELICAAAEMGEKDFIEKRLPPVLEMCGKNDELDFLMCLLDVYEGEKLAELRHRISALLPEVSLNEYFKGKIRERIGELPVQ